MDHSYSDSSSEGNISVEVFDINDDNHDDLELMGDNPTLTAGTVGTEPYLFEPVVNNVDEAMTIEVENDV